eukprot:CAMPEP_0171297040 /NCGR_PEP_ID=MMETSP0816-20121228/5794_1 /TAXON_ID=420281 /ORGANISM="Proboscia inermis, Strain CCAP1064/1" /LENGTH=85 /DNA_ID=CAMNT_0011771001 /DNA_START=96 /DNA_END=353 /DNA_ORIENTATION=+
MIKDIFNDTMAIEDHEETSQIIEGHILGHEGRLKGNAIDTIHTEHGADGNRDHPYIFNGRDELAKAEKERSRYVCNISKSHQQNT